MEQRTPGVGVGLGPRNRIPESVRQDALDAAAVLQLRRSETAAALAQGAAPGAEVVARGGDEINEWMMRAAHEWRELLSVRPAATVEQLRVSLPNNRLIVERGLRMISLFDHDSLDADARLLLACEPLGNYLFGVAPVQMKIVDRRHVLLQGPFLDDDLTVMAVSEPTVMAAAWRYWNAVVASSFPVAQDRTGLTDLTPRQLQIVALLAADARDEAIATSLDVSVRTVRADISSLMDSLGVRSRFSAGLRLQLWGGA